MNIPQIQIRQQYAKIGMDIREAELQIQQKDAEISIQQPAAKLEIRQVNVELKIDNYPHRYDLNIKNPTDFLQDTKQYSRQKILQSIARIAQNGDRIMRLKNKGNIIAEIAAEETFQPEGRLSIKWLRGPKFEAVPGKVDIEAEERKVSMDVKLNKPEVVFNRGTVRVSMAQYNQISIELPGNNLDTTI